LVKYFHEGSYKKHSQAECRFKFTPQIIVPIKGLFEGEKGEWCHLLSLANVMKSGINIRGCLRLLITARNNMHYLGPWAFMNKEGRWNLVK
jgi:hypothetical protein